MVRIDGKTYRIMGVEPKDVPPLEQVGLKVLPTRTIYDFEAAGVHVRLTFTTPVLPDDLDLFARPVTYLTWDVQATDGGEHARLNLLRQLRGTRGQRRQAGGGLVAAGDGGDDGHANRLARAARAAEEGRRPAHRLGLPLRGRAGRRRSIDGDRRPREGSAGVRQGRPPARNR